LLGATAITIAAIVAAVVVIDGGGSPIPEGRFKGAGLSELVLSKAPDNLRITESGDGYPDDLRFLPRPQGAYHNEFTQSERGVPYKYSYATAAVFENENAARVALDDLRNEWQGGFNSSLVRGLGDDGSVFHNTAEPEYIYAWRHDELLQVFDLVWSGPSASMEVARGFADDMNARVP